MLTERGLPTADVVRDVVAEIGGAGAGRAGLDAARPGRDRTIIGARTLGQLADNLGALDVRFTQLQLDALEQAGAVDLGFPYDMLARPVTRVVMLGDVALSPRADRRVGAL